MMTDPGDSTDDVFARAMDGDSAALGEILVRHRPALAGLVRLYASDELLARESVQDVAQSVYRAAIIALPDATFASENEFRSWLFKIALNKVRDRGRKSRAAVRDVRRERTVAFDNDSPESVLDCYQSFCTPSRDAIAHEEMARIERAFRTLKPEDQTVIVLVRMFGVSHAAAAEELACSEKAAAARLSRALVRLAAAM